MVKLIGTTMKSLHIFLVLMIFSAASSLSHAEIYKWKDKNGAIRYTDTPPPSNIKQEALSGKKAAKSSNQAPLAPVEGVPAVASKDAKKEGKKEAMSKEDEAAQIRQRNAEAEKRNKQEKEAEAKRKADNCKGAKANFETYKQGGRVYKMNEKGEREYMDDKDLQDGKAQAQKEIDENCN
jgi:Skp family chaperone for outer membrane proteins